MRVIVRLLAALVLLSPAACTAHTASPTAVQRWIAHTPMYIAHRGGDVNWPEGTAYAYAHAAAWNPDLALEVPVRRSSDGVWVVSEDATTGRVFGTDFTIRTTPWPILSALRTTRGGFPMARLVNDVLDVYGAGRILFLDDKTGQDRTAFFDLLSSFGGPDRIVIKSFCSAVAVPVEAHRRGYLTWGYYYADTMAQFHTTQGRFDLLGLNQSAPASDFATMRATGKPVLAHLIASKQAADLVDGEGVAGLMVSNVVDVVPH